MNWLIYHVASGTAFFSGAVCVLLALALGTRENRWTRRLGMFLCIVGGMLITVSAAPLSPWYYGAVATAVCVWLVAVDARVPRRVARAAVSLLLATGVGLGIVWEAPYHLPPRLASEATDAIVVFGDSITAGIGENEAEIWPAILARTQPVVVHDFSHMGATVSSTLKEVRRIEVPAGIVLLEIGGNDLLGSSTPVRFRRDLDSLLSHISAPGRQIVMLELPLPPFYNEFGRVQRELAKKHFVRLIPKRVLMRVLTAEGATLDSVHLSQAGHQLMAAEMWQIIRTAFEP